MNYNNKSNNEKTDEREGRSQPTSKCVPGGSVPGVPEPSPVKGWAKAPTKSRLAAGKLKSDRRMAAKILERYGSKLAVQESEL